jgi:hypothetical protein
LRHPAGRFDAFVTMDKNIVNQQAVAALPFGILLLLAPSNRLRDLQPLVVPMLQALAGLRPGTVVRVGA